MEASLCGLSGKPKLDYNAGLLLGSNVMADVARTLSVMALAASLSGQPALADSARAKPQAVAAYREGMNQLSLPRPNLDKAKRYFDKAAALKLPHADYGRACIIYMLRNPDRFDEAFSLAKRAADHNVYEARALLVGYYRWGIGTERDYKASDAIFHDLISLDFSHGLTSGAPGTVEIKDPELARRFIKRALTSGQCGPKIPLTRDDAEKDIVLPKRLYGPNEDGVFPPEASPN